MSLIPLWRDPVFFNTSLGNISVEDVKFVPLMGVGLGGLIALYQLALRLDSRMNLSSHVLL